MTRQHAEYVIRDAAEAVAAHPGSANVERYLAEIVAARDELARLDALERDAAFAEARRFMGRAA